MHKSALIILDGQIPSLALLRHFWHRNDLKVFADGALYSSQKIGFKEVDGYYLVGDLDSFDKRGLQERSKETTLDFPLTDFDSRLPEGESEILMNTGDNDLAKVRVIFSPNQDSTDADKALEFVISEDVNSIDLLGSEGLRFDHTLYNINLLQKYHGKADLRIWNDLDCLRLYYPGYYRIKEDPRIRISFLPYNESVEMGKVSGVDYNISNTTLSKKAMLSVSNRTNNEFVEFEIKKGELLLITENMRLNF